MCICILNTSRMQCTCVKQCQGPGSDNKSSWTRVNARKDQECRWSKGKGTRPDCEECRFKSCQVLSFLAKLNCSKRNNYLFKLNMLLHHMESQNIDIGFITEILVNNIIMNFDSITSQVKQEGYTIISQQYTNSKEGGQMFIHKLGLNVQKVKTI